MEYRVRMIIVNTEMDKTFGRVETVSADNLGDARLKGYEAAEHLERENPARRCSVVEVKPVRIRKKKK